MAERNPVVVPPRITNKIVCPKCGHDEFGGRRIQGTVVRTCTKCNQQWSGGYGMTPAESDPTVPVRHDPYVPPIRVNLDSKGGVVEERKRPDAIPDFRKGAPITSGEE